MERVLLRSRIEDEQMRPLVARSWFTIDLVRYRTIPLACVLPFLMTIKRLQRDLSSLLLTVDLISCNRISDQ